MPRHLKRDVIDHLRTTGVVAVFHNAEIDAAIDVADALCRGGITAIEYTNRGDHALETFAALERFVRGAHPTAHIGVGSVIDAGTATASANAGADFIVGPALVPEVARTCNRRQLLYIPGCGSVTEMIAANELGCEIVKLFPAESLGPEFLRAAMAPCPWLQIMPSGGVTTGADNLEAWYRSGAFAVSMGSQLVRTDLVEAGRWDELTAIAGAASAVVASVR
jgi:2-dehydro-3-deoxyphosphogluconate aldolase / (4S)-4-hydroxy-2-oxoglutarate aldolase